MSDILEILVEERSMENFLYKLLPTILPQKFTLGENCSIHCHEGKSDLKRSIPKKVRAYNKHYRDFVYLMILHDQDSADCKKLKDDLLKLVNENISENQKVNVKFKIRIVCKELENWYFGDLLAIQKIIPTFKPKKYQDKATFTNVDTLHISGDKKLKALVSKYGKVNLAKKMGETLTINTNKSKSFNTFVQSIKNLEN